MAGFRRVTFALMMKSCSGSALTQGVVNESPKPASSAISNRATPPAPGTSPSSSTSGAVNRDWRITLVADTSPAISP